MLYLKFASPPARALVKHIIKYHKMRRPTKFSTNIFITIYKTYEKNVGLVSIGFIINGDNYNMLLP